MPSRPRSRLALLAWALLAAWALAPAVARAGELVAVVNEHNTVDEMSLQRLRLIYGAYKRTWSDGKPITLVLPGPRTPAMTSLVTKVFKKQSEEEVSQYYLDLVFQQKLAKEPPRLAAADGIAIVRADEGAIVILDRDEVGPASGVRLVPVPGL